MKIKGKTYKERTAHQLEEWVKGNAIHNTVDDECCPDFSCCNKKMNTPIGIRKTFHAACLKDDEETKMGMLMNFLGNAIATTTDKTVYITDGNVSIKKDLN